MSHWCLSEAVIPGFDRFFDEQAIVLRYPAIAGQSCEIRGT